MIGWCDLIELATQMDTSKNCNVIARQASQLSHRIIVTDKTHQIYYEIEVDEED